MFYRGLFFKAHGDAEKLKCLITEDKFRSEEKFQSPIQLPSFHNFCVASNSQKAVEVPNEERRFFLLQCTRLTYSKAHWDLLWANVQDDTVRRLFYQYCLTIDTSIITKGQAPFTQFKQSLQADQAPMAIKWVKHVILSDPDALNWMVPKEINKPTERENVAADLDSGLFSLKFRPAESAAYNALAGDAYEQLALQLDLAPRGQFKTVVPRGHVAECILNHFRGQAYRSSNEDEVIADLVRLGLTHTIKKIPHGGTSRRCIVFPSINAIKYLLRKKNWLSAADEAGIVEDE